MPRPNCRDGYVVPVPEARRTGASGGHAMRSKWVAVGSGLFFAGLLAISLWDRSAHAVLPPGYAPVPGTVPLNPAQVGTVGSQFTQDCTGVPQPPPPGGVVWH